ncbi:hypothetical protein PV516_19275 [Streptomyces scabiei]|uniref:hypothetical protein n=1 Tax=Streptomyces scabiei TaxID=1930 RepID=UPI0029B79F62|nr:hypothetical protein [Streptomyces scabiei]MDX3165931.1 hypothetical protein [Streptomyces scabiei]
MKTANALEQAKAEMHLHYDAWYGDEYTDLADLINSVVSAAQSGNETALSQARAEFHNQKDAWYGEDYTHLTGLLDDLATAATA